MITSLRSAISAVSLVVIIGTSLPVRAAVSNGNFQATPDHFQDWNTWTSGSPCEIGTVDHYGSYYSTIAHLHAQATYQWDGYDWIGNDGYVQLNRYPDYVVTIGQGQTVLQFDAARILDGEDLANPKVTIIATNSPDPNLIGWAIGKDVRSSIWSTFQIPLWDDPDNPLPPGTEIEILIETFTNQPYRDGASGEQITQTIDLYVDNFMLVPLPGTLLLLLSGGAILLRRYRR